MVVSKGMIKDLEKTYNEVMTQTKDGSKFNLTSASLAIKFRMDEDLAYLLARALDLDGDGEIDFSELVTTLYILSEDSTQEEKIDFCFRVYDQDNDGFLTAAEYANATDLLIQNMSKLSNSMNQYLANTDVKTFREDEFAGVKELSPKELQHQITTQFLAEADTDGDGKISAEEFKAFALQHPESLMGLVRMQRILTDLLKRCKKIRLNREQTRGDNKAGKAW